MASTHGDTRRAAWLLLAGPLLFLLAFGATGAYFSASGAAPEAVPALVAGAMPQLLLGVLLALGTGMLVVAGPQARAVWQALPRSGIGVDAGIGAAVGVALAAGYFGLLLPLTTLLQTAVGDYVPAGATLPAVSANLGIFFVANVVLAPVVEETLYRGVAFRQLLPRFGRMRTVVATCAAFGLLHWAGGFWYMVVTGVVAGGAFAALRVWRGTVVAPFAAHLVLNALEFAFVLRGGG